MQSILAQVEKERQQHLNSSNACKIGIAVLGFIIIVSTLGMFQMREHIDAGYLVPFLFVDLVAMGVLLVCVNRSGHFEQQFAIRYKTMLTKPLLSEIAPELDYKPSQGIAEADFRKSRLFGGFNRYTAEDFISGSVEGVSFKMSQVLAKYRGGQNQHTREIFRGCFFMIASHSFGYKAHTLLQADIAERGFGATIGNFLQTIGSGFSERQLVKIQDQPEFERLYVVYSSEQNEAYRICSPAVCDYLLQSNSRGLFLSLSFQPDWIYIALHSKKDFLAVNLQQSISQQQLDKHGQELKAQIEFLRDFIGCLRS